MGQVVFLSTHRKGARHILDMQEGGRSSLLVSLYYYIPVNRGSVSQGS